jgi:hypothetical protein
MRVCLRRREFFAALGGAATRGDQPEPYRVGAKAISPALPTQLELPEITFSTAV